MDVPYRPEEPGIKPTLDEIFSPRGAAIVGASPLKLSFAELVLHSLKEARFPAVYPVNPNYKEVLGLACYARLTDIPGVVDHVIVSIPAEAVLKLLDDCAEKRVRSVHFFTAGFGETGEAPKEELERAMLAKARAGGFRIIGPNCVGLYVPKSRLVNTLNSPLDPGPIAFISQSGGHAQNLPDYGRARGLRFSKVVSYGNALDVNESELLDYFSRDPETEIIAAYIEGVRDGRRFQRALAEAGIRKPVVIYKGGRTAAGKRAAYGHTASLSSSVAIFEALCRQAGAIQVDDLEEMIDVLTALCFLRPLPRGIGAALMGAGGGPSVLAGDEMEKEGLRLPCLSPAVQAELKQKLPVAGSIFTNPLDAPNLIIPEAISTVLQVFGRVPEIDILIYHLGFHPLSHWGWGRLSLENFVNPAIGVLKEAQRKTGRAVLLALRPPQVLTEMAEFLSAQQAFVKAGFPVFYSLRQLARALVRVIAWNRSYLDFGGPGGIDKRFDAPLSGTDQAIGGRLCAKVANCQGSK
jgi:acyl-CoA synthetase (NDP forming)